MVNLNWEIYENSFDELQTEVIIAIIYFQLSECETNNTNDIYKLITDNLNEFCGQMEEFLGEISRSEIETYAEQRHIYLKADEYYIYLFKI